MCALLTLMLMLGSGSSMMTTYAATEVSMPDEKEFAVTWEKLKQAGALHVGEDGLLYVSSEFSDEEYAGFLKVITYWNAGIEAGTVRIF